MVSKSAVIADFFLNITTTFIKGRPSSAMFSENKTFRE